MLFVEHIVGLAIGIILGLATWLFKFIEHKSYCNMLKAIYMFACCIGPVTGAEVVKWSNCKFLGAMFFGYTCYRMLGDKGKPTKELALIWFWL